MMEQQSLRKLALAGTVSMLPAALIVIPGIAQSVLGSRLINDALDALFADPTFRFMKAITHPAVILGGLTIAFILNALPLLRLTFDAEETSIVAKILLKGRSLNLFVTAGCLLLFATILAFSVVENFQIVPR